jgi:hypothetical protein
MAPKRLNWSLRRQTLAEKSLVPPGKPIPSYARRDKYLILPSRKMLNPYVVMLRFDLEYYLFFHELKIYRNKRPYETHHTNLKFDQLYESSTPFRTPMVNACLNNCLTLRP